MSLKAQKILFFAITILIIACFYLPTVTRGWQAFDEWGLFYNENLYPFPENLSELFEIISAFALNANLESQNLLFSKIINIRSSPFGTILNIILGFLFNKNPVLYHLLTVLLHILNSVFIWILVCEIYKKNELIKNNFILPSLLTLIWALHPANIEAVMMSTNWLSLLTVTVSLILITTTIKEITADSYKHSIKRQITIAVLLIFLGEYGSGLVLAIFFISLAVLLNKIKNYKKAVQETFRISMPYFYGLALYMICYLSKGTYHSFFSTNLFSSFIERVLWFSPQIFIHFLKLIFFPKDLSIFQSTLVHFGTNQNDAYAIFALCIMIIILVLPLVFLITFFRTYNLASLILLFYALIFSFFPYLHIFAPAYCLIAERYCYFPLFLLVLLFVFFTCQIVKSQILKTLVISCLFILAVSPGIRTSIRLPEWKDSFRLYLSAAKNQKNNLYKGLVYSTVGYSLDLQEQHKEAKKYFNKSILILTNAIKELQHKNQNVRKVFKIYGIDNKTLVINAAFRIASIKFFQFHENAHTVLNFYEPFIKNSLSYTGSSQLDLYAKLLQSTGNNNRALTILKYAKKLYPNSPTIIFSLTNAHLKLKQINEVEKIIKEAEHLYPNYIKTILLLVKLSEIKKDYLTQAKYEYLLGLRLHSEQAYQKSLQLYLSQNKLKEAKKPLKNLLLLNKNNPVTLLLAGRYYLLVNEKDKALNTFEQAYKTGKIYNIKGELEDEIYESILLNLISINLSYNKPDEAKKYISELEEVKAKKK